MNDSMTQTPDITPEQFQDFISNLLNKEIIPFLYEKNKKYKGASFQNGIMALVGNTFRQEDKLLRMKHLVFEWMKNGMEEFEQPFGESIWDTIRDQLGYALIGLTVCSLYDIGPYKFEDYTDTKGMSTSEVWNKVAEHGARNSSGPFGYDEDEESDEEDFIIDIEDMFLSNLDSPEMFAASLKVEVRKFLNHLSSSSNYVEKAIKSL